MSKDGIGPNIRVQSGERTGTIHPGFPALYLVKALVRLSQLRDLS